MKTYRGGFTLVELAIVLVIIAAILGFISTGQVLYQQAKLRSVIVDFKQIETSYIAFYNRYKEPPGDFSQGASLWGATCATTISCSGNGNRVVENQYNSVANESARAWKHLELSGLLPYGFPVIPASWVGKLTLDQAPKSKIDLAGYFIAGTQMSIDTGFNRTSPFNSISNQINAVFIGRESYEVSLVKGALTPQEAFSIDIKFDDGKLLTTGEATGNFTGYFRVVDDEDEYFYGAACLTPDSFTSTATYNMASTTERCIAGFQLDKER